MNHFHNHTTLIIIDSAIKEISKNDLAGLQGLVRFYIQMIGLMSLPEDSFTKMPNLRIISCSGNQIEFTFSKFLEPLLGRQNVYVSLQGNNNFDARFWPHQCDEDIAIYNIFKSIKTHFVKSNSTNFYFYFATLFSIS